LVAIIFIVKALSARNLNKKNLGHVARLQQCALETQEFRTTPAPFWLVSFSDTVKGPIKNMFFVVLLPDGTAVEPGVEKRLQARQELLQRRGDPRLAR
jgi:hypothetical protein